MSKLKLVGFLVGAFVAVTTFVVNVPYVLMKDYESGLISNGGHISLGWDSNQLIFSSENKNFVFFAVPSDLKKNYDFIIPMRLNLHNSLQVEDQKVTLSIKYGKENKRSSFSINQMVNRGHRFNDEIEFELTKTRKYDFAKFRISSIEDDNNFPITEYAYASKKAWGNELPVLFQNSLSVETEVETDSVKDKRRRFVISYNGVNIENPKEMFQWVYHFYGKRMAIDIRKEHSFLSYIYNIILGKEVKIFAFYPDFKEIEDQQVYIPIINEDEESTYNAFVFKPYSWDLLFD